MHLSDRQYALCLAAVAALLFNILAAPLTMQATSSLIGSDPLLQVMAHSVVMFGLVYCLALCFGNQEDGRDKN